MTELGQSLREAWSITPQEWWFLWSFKYGKRHKRMKHNVPSDEQISAMRKELDAEVEKEKLCRQKAQSSVNSL